MKVNKKSMRLTFVQIGCFAVLAICARITERALPTAAAASDKRSVV